MREKHTPGQKMNGSSEKTEEKIAFLSHHSIFRHLNPADVNDLDRSTTATTYPPGRIIYRPGETSTALFLVKEGQVQLYHLSTDGRKLVTATLQAGTCFGEIPLIWQGKHASFAETVEETVIYIMGRHDIEHLLLHKPAITYALLQVVGERLAQRETQLIDTTFKGTSARLATLLLQLAHTQADTEQTLVVDGFSHEELADRLGVYRETVSTALRELKDAGAIEMGRKHITICAPALLKDQASSSKRP